VGQVDVLHTLDPERANEPDFLAPLQDADCVWLGGGAQGRLRDAYVDTRVQDALHAVLLRGGIVGGYSAGAAILSEVIIRRGNPDPVEDVGFGVLPGVIVDQHFLAKKREPRLRSMLARHPERIGYGVDEDTALLVHGSSYEVIGNSVVRRCEHTTGCVSLEAGARGSFP
jgi:cyanophycinase